MDTVNREQQTLGYRHPVVWYGVAFGVFAGGVLAAAAVGKVTQGQELLAVCGVGVAACCYAFAGAFASRPGYSVRDGLKAGLLAGVISAAISVPVDLICTQVLMSAYRPHMEDMHSSLGGFRAILTPAQVYGYEVQGVTYGAIGALVAGAGLGWLGGYFGFSKGLGWEQSWKPMDKAKVPTASPSETGTPETPSGPRWELAHPPSPRAGTMNRDHQG
jgi:hypothetical protein